MKQFKVLSALLLYPEPELIEHLPLLEEMAAEQEGWQEALAPLFAYLRGHGLIEVQQNYVGTFDRTPSHSLHLFEHIHGESRDRGQAMVDLMGEYRKHGLEMQGNDLPDYVPLFLEFLSQQEEDESRRLLSDAVHVLAHLGRKLRANDSPYAAVFTLLERYSPVAAEELSEPPVRDMDEALETFGPGVDGVEPLLRKAAGGVQPVNFYPKGAHGASRAA
ncbi:MULTISPECIES: nitrate reductase molybdenum cofactor assembly chaperone [unclassified Massilia]|uniref:nitrate reductase molybdenum cofactor assembly chaperone n=1 Tax=unclassified Massilia TaxID=2609279 RepID=UPI00067CB537|nr:MULTISPECIES: nitrate reductase molybdenum cofactor assembly chaperone [unclassified Massilia]AKU20542.1 nitrate reductase [Massilia sp. NR 4-1]NVD99361.1 nitrate reductase molybdenum cofactor assembly chaperone [Massilia sp. BJB1822]